MKKYFPHFPRPPLHSLIKIQVNVGELVSETCYSSQVNFQIPCPALIRRCNSLLWKARPRWWIEGQVQREFFLYLCGVRKWPKRLTLILLTSWRSSCLLFSLRHLKGLYWYFYCSQRGNWKRLAPSAGLRLCLLFMHGSYSLYQVVRLACWWVND